MSITDFYGILERTNVRHLFTQTHDPFLCRAKMAKSRQSSSKPKKMTKDQKKVCDDWCVEMRRLIVKIVQP
jgi:hypothetical protein